MRALIIICIYAAQTKIQSFLCPHPWWPQQSYWPTMAQVMPCSLMTPKHYLNQCWHGIFDIYPSTISKNIHKMWLQHLLIRWLEKDIKILCISARGQWVKWFNYLFSFLIIYTQSYFRWQFYQLSVYNTVPDSKVHGVNMGPTWSLSAPDGPHVGPMNLAIRVEHPCITGRELRSGVKCIVLTIVTGSLWLVWRYRWNCIEIRLASTIPSQ